MQDLIYIEVLHDNPSHIQFRAFASLLCVLKEVYNEARNVLAEKFTPQLKTNFGTIPNFIGAKTPDTGKWSEWSGRMRTVMVHLQERSIHHSFREKIR